MSKIIANKLNALCNTVAENIPKSNALFDTFGRKHTYLRISLSERCNLRCTYCMPEEGIKLTQNDKLLTGQEIFSLVKVFAKYGVDKIRFTGGEPLIRKDCVDIIRNVSQIESIKKIAMTTNGITLSRKIKDLKEAGLTHLNISLDTLEEKKFEFIAKRKGFHKVMNSIEAALDTGYAPLKINCVVMRGINDDEICNFIEMTKDKNVDIRFIEYMPFDGNKWNTKKMVSYKELLKIVATKYPIESIDRLQDDPNDTSKAYKINNYKGQFGFITSMTNHFCNTCNRVRLTADGNLKVCLFGNTEVSLRDALRNNLNENDLAELIKSAVTRKKEKHAGMNNLPNLKNRPMILIDKFKNKQLINPFLHLFSSLKSSSFDQIRYITKDNSNNLSQQFTHFNNETNEPKQVDISEKSHTNKIRIACATGYIQLNKEAFNALIENKLKKGNALIVAQIAGIQASKQTSSLIPLCHSILLDSCEVSFKLDENNFRIYCETICKTSTSKTGVEMEALTSNSIALLTIYDMCKAVQKDASINDIKLEYKYGGKSDFKRNYE